MLPDNHTANEQDHILLFAPKGRNISAQGRAKRRKPRSAALGQPTHANPALKGRYNPPIFQIIEHRITNATPFLLIGFDIDRAEPVH